MAISSDESDIDCYSKTRHKSATKINVVIGGAVDSRNVQCRDQSLVCVGQQAQERVPQVENLRNTTIIRIETGSVGTAMSFARKVRQYG